MTRRAVLMVLVGTIALLTSPVGVAGGTAHEPIGGVRAVDIVVTSEGTGYWVLDDAARVTALGTAIYHGGSPLLGTGERAVALMATASGGGYWIVTSTGAVHAFGDAVDHGDVTHLALNASVVDAVATPSGGGYLLLGADGGVFTFGDAVFAGSVQGIVDQLIAPGFPAAQWLDAPIVAVATTPSGQGYHLVGADGGVFAFGDGVTRFRGSVPGVLGPDRSLAAPVVGAVAAPGATGAGYLLVGADGGAFAFGDAAYHGSAPGAGTTVDDVVAVTIAGDLAGYAMVGAGGAIHPFGSMASTLGHLTEADVRAPADPGDTVDCADFATLGDAQLWFDRHRPFHGDVGGLDDDSDGVACENDLLDVDPGLLVAFIGDAGPGPEATAVLELIRDEGADLVIHLGDFDYLDDPDAFEAAIDAVLGPDFPYFAAVGNHDLVAWDGYQADLEARMARVPGASCDGEYGVNSVCTYRGLEFVLSGVGTLGTAHESFLESALGSSRHRWRVCAWHKNQRAMQVGDKGDEVGWEAYEICREHGAIVATGHEHSYSRTRTLTDVSDRRVDAAHPGSGAVHVGAGSTFVFVSGLGGHSERPQSRCLPATPPYGCDGEWAAISSASNGAEPGALFLELHVDGDRRAGRGRFVDVDGTVVDSFTIGNANERR